MSRIAWLIAENYARSGKHGFAETWRAWARVLELREQKAADRLRLDFR